MTGKALFRGAAVAVLLTFATTSSAQAPPQSSNASAAVSAVRRLYESVRRGVVAIEPRGTLATGLGTVLDGDGRILTALSALRGAGRVQVRYADGTRAQATLVLQDAARDLALLQPEGALRTEGLRASELRSGEGRIGWWLPTTSAGGLAPAHTIGLRTVRSPEGEVVRLLDVDAATAPIAGAPLLDANGQVAGVLVRPACTPIVGGAPVSEIRAFLAPAAPSPGRARSPRTVSPSPRGWLGMQGASTTIDGLRGVRVLAVAPGSPAAQASLSPDGDVVVAVDGDAVHGPEDLAAAIAKRTVGQRTQLLICRGNAFREITILLQAAPAR